MSGIGTQSYGVHLDAIQLWPVLPPVSNSRPAFVKCMGHAVQEITMHIVTLSEAFSTASTAHFCKEW